MPTPVERPFRRVLATEQGAVPGARKVAGSSVPPRTRYARAGTRPRALIDSSKYDAGSIPSSTRRQGPLGPERARLIPHRTSRVRPTNHCFDWETGDAGGHGRCLRAKADVRRQQEIVYPRVPPPHRWKPAAPSPNLDPVTEKADACVGRPRRRRNAGTVPLRRWWQVLPEHKIRVISPGHWRPGFRQQGCRSTPDNVCRANPSARCCLASRVQVDGGPPAKNLTSTGCRPRLHHGWRRIAADHGRKDPWPSARMCLQTMARSTPRCADQVPGWDFFGVFHPAAYDHRSRLLPHDRGLYNEQGAGRALPTPVRSASPRRCTSFERLVDCLQLTS